MKRTPKKIGARPGDVSSDKNLTLQAPKKEVIGIKALEIWNSKTHEKSGWQVFYFSSTRGPVYLAQSDQSVFPSEAEAMQAYQDSFKSGEQA